MEGESTERLKKWKRIEHSIDAIFVRKIYPNWFKERANFTNSYDYEVFCLNYPSLDVFPQHLKKELLFIFGNEKNLNYYYYWKLMG